MQFLLTNNEKTLFQKSLRSHFGNVFRTFMLKYIPKYSHLPIKRAGCNKRAGGDFLQKSLNEQGENMPNKRAGRNFSKNCTNEQGCNHA